MPALPASMRPPILVGEQNPHGADPRYALYPAPDGCSGHRLCCLILGMRRSRYLAAFRRVNLCDGPWNPVQARRRATELWTEPGRFILLGAKVCHAWQTPFVPFSITDGGTTLVLPHPSGRNLLWNRQGIIEEARSAVLRLAPELDGLLGICHEEVA